MSVCNTTAVASFPAQECGLNVNLVGLGSQVRLPDTPFSTRWPLDEQGEDIAQLLPVVAHLALRPDLPAAVEPQVREPGAGRAIRHLCRAGEILPYSSLLTVRPPRETTSGCVGAGRRSSGCRRLAERPHPLVCAMIPRPSAAARSNGTTH